MPYQFDEILETIKMIDLGILAWPAYILHHGITAAHTKEDLDKISERAYIALKEVRKIS